jgi:hypothetical protein
VDALASGTEGVLEKAMEIAEARASLAKTGVFGLIKVIAYFTPVSCADAEICLVLYQKDVYYDALEVTRRAWEGTNALLEDKAARARL